MTTQVSQNQVNLRRSEARNKAIDHTHYFPTDPFVIANNPDEAGHAQGFAAGATDTVVPANTAPFFEAQGHYFLDVDIAVSEGTATGKFSIWALNKSANQAMLLGVQSFDTAVSNTYRVELGGRAFHLRADAITSVSTLGATVSFHGVLI